MGEFALALSGGGAKGAYQIGLWKALIDKKMYKNIVAYSGTSVGALNAVMMAMGDFECAKVMWRMITLDGMLSLDFGGPSLFTRPQLENILRKLDYSRLKRGPAVYINIYNEVDKRTESVYLNDKSKEAIINYLLASSAIKFFGSIYPTKYIGTKGYSDAGLNPFDNTPIEPLYKLGYKNIWVSVLTDTFNLQDLKEQADQKYNDLTFKVFKPNKSSYHWLLNTIDFNQKRIEERIIDGYIDTIKLISNEDISAAEAREILDMV